MPRLLDDIAVYINAQNTSFTIGGKLWKGRLPDTPDECIALLEVLGTESPNETFGASGSFNWEMPQLQILSRAAQHDYETARTNAETIYKILRSVYNTTTGINGTKYHFISVQSPPHYQGEDENSRHLISFICEITKDPSS